MRKTPSDTSKKHSNNLRADFASKLRFWHKLVLILAIPLVPTFALLTWIVSQQLVQLSSAQQVLKSSDEFKSLHQASKLFLDFQRYNEMRLLGVKDADELQTQRQAELDKALGNVIRINAQSSYIDGAKLQALSKAWDSYKVDIYKLSMEESVAQSDDIHSDYFKAFYRTMAINSGMLSTPDIVSNLLANIVANVFPETMNELADARSTVLLTKEGNDAYTLKDYAEIGEEVAEADENLQSYERATVYAMEASLLAKKSLEKPLEQLNTVGYQLMDDLIDILVYGNGNISSVNVTQRFDEVNDLQNKAVDTTLQLIQQFAQARVSHLTNLLWLYIGGALAILLLVLFITYNLVRTMNKSLTNLTDASSRLAKGDFELGISINSHDEFGQLATAFKYAATQLNESRSIQEAEQVKARDLQNNVQNFLSVATEIAQGDFTKRGKVTSDALGNVVDAINLMTEEVAYLLKDVQKAADRVNAEADQMSSLTASIASGAQVQTGELEQVRERTHRATRAIREMAERAGSSVQQAQMTLEAAQAGRSAVSETLSGMNDLRIEIQGIAENIKHLSQRSAEIETISKTLENFASQTNLLAINASFEAAGAGAAGRRFAVIAEEIRSLAESSARETARVGILVQEVQGSIQGVVSMAQDGVRQVENGYNVANTAGKRLEEIATLAGQTATVANQISKLAQTQVAVVEQVGEAVQTIAHTASQTEAQSLQGREAAQEMRQLSEQLTNNLGRFRLPS